MMDGELRIVTAVERDGERIEEVLVSPIESLMDTDLALVCHVEELGRVLNPSDVKPTSVIEEFLEDVVEEGVPFFARDVVKWARARGYPLNPQGVGFTLGRRAKMVDDINKIETEEGEPTRWVVPKN